MKLRIIGCGLAAALALAALTGCTPATYAFARLDQGEPTVILCTGQPPTGVKFSTGDVLKDAAIAWTAKGPALALAAQIHYGTLPADWESTAGPDSSLSLPAGGYLHVAWESDPYRLQYANFKIDDLTEEKWTNQQGDQFSEPCF